jgi:hypothetical protein
MIGLDLDGRILPADPTGNVTCSVKRRGVTSMLQIALLALLIRLTRMWRIRRRSDTTAGIFAYSRRSVIRFWSDKARLIAKA